MPNADCTTEGNYGPVIYRLQLWRISHTIMPVPYSEDLRWRVIWSVYNLQCSLEETSFNLNISHRTVQRYISNFLASGDLVSMRMGRKLGSILEVEIGTGFFVC